MANVFINFKKEIRTITRNNMHSTLIIYVKNILKNIFWFELLFSKIYLGTIQDEK